MKRRSQFPLLFLLGIMLAACASEEPPAAVMLGNTQWPPTEYKHTVSTGAVRQYWNCARPEPGVMRLDGVAVNLWSGQPIRFLEWELVGTDKDGRTVSSVKVASKAIQLMTNQYTKFQIDLRTIGNEVRFDLHYNYRYNEGEGGRGLEASLDWDGPVLFAQQSRRFFVLDACSDMQHLVR